MWHHGGIGSYGFWGLWHPGVQEDGESGRSRRRTWSVEVMSKGRLQLARERGKYEARARFIRALAHPTRLFIVDTLGAGEQCVQALHELIPGDRSTLSKHLAVLRDAGVVTAEKRGACVYYSLRTSCILGFFNCVEQALCEAATEHYEIVGCRK